MISFYDALERLIESNPWLTQDPAVQAHIRRTGVLLAFAEALYGPSPPRPPRPRRSRRLTVSRPQRAIKRSQRRDQ